MDFVPKNLKVFVDDKKNVPCIMGIVYPTVKTLFEQEKKLVMSIYSFSINVFNKLLFQPIGILSCWLMNQYFFFQALYGFLFVVTCDGEVFYAARTVEQYLGFHQVRTRLVSSSCCSVILEEYMSCFVC